MTATDKFTSPKPDPCSPRLVETIKTLIYRSPVNAVQVAEFFGCSPDYFYSLATHPSNQSGKHRHMPLHRLVPLALQFQNFCLLDYLEASCGRTAVKIPLAQPTPSPALQRTQLLPLAAVLVQALANAAPDAELVPLLTTLVQHALHYTATVTLPPEAPHG